MKKKVLALILVLAMLLSLAACGGNTDPTGGSETQGPAGSTEETKVSPEDYEECETAWEMQKNLKMGWNLGCSLSPYSSTAVDAFVALIYFHDTAELYNRSVYTNYFDGTTGDVEVEWEIADEEGYMQSLYEDAEIDEFGIEVWNFALGTADKVTIDVQEFYYVDKDGKKVELTAGLGEQTDCFEGGTGAYALTDLDPDVKVKDVKSAYAKVHFVEMKSEGEITDDVITSYETMWGNPVTTQALIDTVAEKGFNIIRPQVSWINHMDEEGNLEPKWLERVAENVDYCMNAGVYCIINTTGAGWLTAEPESYEQNSKIYKKVWQQIAERFKDYGELLIFESFNEILYQGMWGNPPEEAYEVIGKLHQDFVDTVRAAGGYNTTRNLCLNTYGTACDYGMNSYFTLPKDTVEGHLFAQVHCYEPNQFTFNETNLGGTNFTNEWGTDEEKARIDYIMDDVRLRFINELNIPVIIGEFGVVDRAPIEERVEWVTYFVNAAQSRNIKLIYFDDGADFAIIDRSSLTWKYPKIVEALFQDTELLPEDYKPEREPVTPPASDLGELVMEDWYSARLFTYGPAWSVSDWAQYDAATRTVFLEWDLDGTPVQDLNIELNNAPAVSGSFEFDITEAKLTKTDGTVEDLTDALGKKTVAVNADNRVITLHSFGSSRNQGVITVKYTVSGANSSPVTPTEPTEPTEPVEEPTEPAKPDTLLGAKANADWYNPEGWLAIVATTTSLKNVKPWTYGRIADGASFDPETNQAELTWVIAESDPQFFPLKPEDDMDGIMIELWNFPLGERIKNEKIKVKAQYRIEKLEYTLADGTTKSCGLDGSVKNVKLSNTGTAGGSIFTFEEGNEPLVKDIKSVHAILTLMGEY